MSMEIHITLNPSDKGVGIKVAQQLSWKTSEIEGDPVLGQAAYFYLTKHSLTLDDALQDLVEAQILLVKEGISLIRSKIEAIVYDTKTGGGMMQEEVEEVLPFFRQKAPVPGLLRKTRSLYFQESLGASTINS